jgi:hypothetical protein
LLQPFVYFSGVIVSRCSLFHFDCGDNWPSVPRLFSATHHAVDYIDTSSVLASALRKCVYIVHSPNQTPLQTLTPQKIKAVAKILNRRFSTSTPFSRAYLKATVGEIRVHGDILKLTGDNKAMASLVAANGKIEAGQQVLGFIPEWRPLRDLNPCYRRERAMS